MNLAAPLKSGDGVVFDGDDEAGIPEQGGRVYEVTRIIRPKSGGPRAVPQEVTAGPVELSFGRHDLDPRRIRPGQRAWKTDDPELTRRLRRTCEGPPHRTVELDIDVRAVAGEPLRIEGRTALGVEASVESAAPLARADRVETTTELVRDQFGRLGGTVYQLGDLRATFEGNPLVPRSLLNALRRDLVVRLDESAAMLRPRTLATDPVLPVLRAPLQRPSPTPEPGELPHLAVLCRTTEQVEAAVASGLATVYADYQDIKGYKDAVTAARRGSATIYLATPRIQKPFESNIFRYLSKQGADGLLVRNAGGLLHCAEQGVPFVADYSLNASNELTVQWFKEHGAERVTASYDLSVDQLLDLIAAVPRPWLEVVIHQQIPMFHMEHCVFCAFLSPGTDKTNCGRPCDHHEVKLRDRVGKEHPLKADVGCRNTLFNAVPQTAAEYLPRLIASGVRRFRVELLDEEPEAVARTLTLYSDALAGRRDARTLWRDLKATNRYGVTRGALSVL